MEYVKAVEGNAEEIYQLVQRTILANYPQYYAREIVDFFCELHNKENILRDIGGGNVWILRVDGQVVGTGSYQGNHITRVYVDPNFQKQGYGSFLMQSLEDEIARHYDFAYVDASLPAKHMYENRGYKTVKYEKWEVEKGVILAYEVMQRKWGNGQSERQNL